jgi:hypothetical protein
MKKLILSLVAIMSLTMATYAGELYNLGNSGAVVAAKKDDLIKILYLVTHGQKSQGNALREKVAIDLPAGTVVEVVGHFPGQNPALIDSWHSPDSANISKIVWGSHMGYIYNFELTRDRYIGKR